MPVRSRQIVDTLAASRHNPQIFLGARWVSRIIQLTPAARKRDLALWLLSISPHYVYPQERGMAGIRKEHERLRKSRNLLADMILRPQFDGAQCIVDYGCGPGYLAGSLSKIARQVVGVDISEGAVSCARLINGEPNVRFELVRNGVIPLADRSVDAICSFAVIQHVTEAEFNRILHEFERVIKPGGKIICHVPVDKPGWETEAAWRHNETLRGRLKLRYALNCFGRTREQVGDAIVQAGFTQPEIRLAGTLGDIEDEDIASQELFVFSPLAQPV